MALRIHALQTGTVAVKTAHKKLRGLAATRWASILLDPSYTEPLPILTWAVEHPEGVILIDTGESAAATRPKHFACDPAYSFLMRVGLLKLAVSPEEEVGPQLRARGIEPGDVRRVVLTHLHLDHADGLAFFPNAEFIVSRREFEGQRRQPRGALACRWPGWFAPRLIDYRPEPLGPFEFSLPLTEDGDVSLVPTPGHSHGHQSVILRHGGLSHFFAGDASFDEQQMLRSEVAGICHDVGEARRSLGLIRRYASVAPTVYLPSHDPASEARLARGTTVMVPPGKKQVSGLRIEGAR